MSFESNPRVAVVTGASSGIGKSTARALVDLGWQVIGVGRDRQRCDAAEADIASAARDGGRFLMVRGDFTLMSEVKRVADEIGTHTARVDVLINNAGGLRDRQIITTDGTEATFAANHLAPFLLTRELMPLLRTCAAESSPGSTRVIAVSSNAHRLIQQIDWADLQGLNTFRVGIAYGQAKLANILFTRELARRIAPHGMIAQTMHPGVVATNFATHGDAAVRAHMATAATVAPAEPAETLVWLASDPEPGRAGGRYFHRQSEESPSDVARDDTAAARLWAESERLLTGIGF